MKFFIANMKEGLLRQLRNRGRRVTRYPLMKFLNDFNIDCVLDVGATVGQYAQEIRSLGYDGRIESFEPISAAFSKLTAAAAADSKWRAHAHALGNATEMMEINVSANSPSSSFLPLNADLATGSIDLKTVSTETVQIRRLDDVFTEIVGSSRNVYLKVDTQGYESRVLDGAEKSLASIAMVQMELSLVTNYDGELLIEEMMQRMRALGFAPWWLLDGFRHPGTLQLLQADVFFARRGFVAGPSKAAA
ncbi:MAG: FkbM family methyltransferase [Planctomycetaceae bacterium]